MLFDFWNFETNIHCPETDVQYARYGQSFFFFFLFISVCPLCDVDVSLALVPYVKEGALMKRMW
jgi:hypothetical protein